MARTNRLSRGACDAPLLATVARWFQLAAVLLVVACVEEPQQDRDRPAVPGGKADHVGPSCEGFCGERNFAARCSCTADCSALQDCCPDIAQVCEVPDLVDRVHEGPGALACTGTFLDQGGYVSCHDADWLIPRWVVYYTDKQALRVNTERTDDFRSDPKLPDGGRAELADYVGSGFHRGHMAPAADFLVDEAASSSTFVLSNVAPQHPSLNVGVWKTLEAQMREAIWHRFGVGWIYTGNLVVDGSGDDAEPVRIGDNGVAIPTHCFKVLLNLEADGSYRAYGFIIPNDPDVEGETHEFQFPIEQIEIAAQIDLFSEFPDDVELKLEQTLFPWPPSRE